MRPRVAIENNAPRMRYHWFRQCGLFVGSGVVEGKLQDRHRPAPQAVRHALDRQRSRRHHRPPLPRGQQHMGNHLQHPTHSDTHRLTRHTPKMIMTTYKIDAHPNRGWRAATGGARGNGGMARLGWVLPDCPPADGRVCGCPFPAWSACAARSCPQPGSSIRPGRDLLLTRDPRRPGRSRRICCSLRPRAKHLASPGRPVACPPLPGAAA